MVDQNFGQARLVGVMSKAGKTIVLLMLTISVGFHWTLLQSIAWVGMVVNYSQSNPIKEALRKTFDGEHPCQICQIVASGKKSERKEQTQAPAKKIELFLAATPRFVLTPAKVALIAWHPGLSARLSDSPPKPPPRLA